MDKMITEAIRKSMKAYWKDKELGALSKVKPPKYNKKYMDSLEKEFLGDKK
jgi:hypothetical protein